MTIHFVHLGRAYMPELVAYVEFLHAAGHQAVVHRELKTVPAEAEVLWWMCGQVGVELASGFPKAFHVHEYASASVPPLAWLKDRIKRSRQAVPHYRIFQNAWVQSRMNFSDTVPYEFRDMGIDSTFFHSQPAVAAAEFDCVYLGEMRRLQHFLPVFDALSQIGRRVLLVGEVPNELRQRLKSFTNMSFTGRISHAEVPAQLRRARFGLNLVPDKLPYTRQTSTKLLEYCAAGLRVISTDYAWVRDFEQRHGGRFSYVPFNAGVADFCERFGAAFQSPGYVVPDVRALAWQHTLAGLQIWRKLGLTL